MKVLKFGLAASMVFFLAACSNTYSSRAECERELARQRGSVAGILVGGSIGDGLGSAVGSVAGNFLGAEVGEKIHDQGTKTEEDSMPQKHTKNIFTGCEPVKTPKK